MSIIEAARAVCWNGASRFGDLLFPPACAVCDVDLAELRDGLRLCDDCRVKLDAAPVHRCPKCAAHVAETFQDGDCPWCRKYDLRFDRTFTLGSYHEALRDAVLQTKRPGNEGVLALLCERFWRQHGPALQAERLEVVVPVPMHWRRRLRRGHNGPDLFAALLAERLRLAVRPRTLARRRWTTPQAGLSVPQRRDNVHNAFVIGRWSGVRGKRVLLVDDILTSGATCSEAARTLKRAGAAAVVVAVAARAQGET